MVGCLALLNRSSEELITLRQLYNTQQEMLEDNFNHQELDSLYFEYNYYYLHEYYQNNYNITLSVKEIVDGINNMVAEMYRTKVVLKPGVGNFLKSLKNPLTNSK